MAAQALPVEKGNRARWSVERTVQSARRFLDEIPYLCLFGRGQLLQRISDRPHGARVQVGLVAEAERRIPRLELPRVLEVADDLVVFGICRHPVPESRRKGRRAGFDYRMNPSAHGAVGFWHRGDLREHDALPVRTIRVQLLDALLHGSFFLVGEASGLPATRGGALGSLIRGLSCRPRGWAHGRNHDQLFMNPVPDIRSQAHPGQVSSNSTWPRMFDVKNARLELRERAALQLGVRLHFLHQNSAISGDESLTTLEGDVGPRD